MVTGVPGWNPVAMSQLTETLTLERTSGKHSLSVDPGEKGANQDTANCRDDHPLAGAAPSPPSPTRLPLAARHALRDGIGFLVEAPEGEIGFVIEVRFAPFEYWPEDLIVETSRGLRLRVPISHVSAVLPREGRLLLAAAPEGAQPIARPRSPRLTGALAWRLAAIAGALLGLGGYAATFVALVLSGGLAWGLGLAVSGALSGLLSAVCWRKRGRSWAAAAGLGSFWLPLVGGTVLTLVLLLG